MANEEHLTRLKQGAEAWNQWRGKHSEIQPDLSRANLRGSVLTRANLYQANLFEADLTEADLIGATLAGANLCRADLRAARLFGADGAGADFTEAIFIGATLYEAYFIGATLARANLAGGPLTQANLVRANLAGATLTQANLSQANLCRADLHMADLSRARLAEAILVEANFEEANLTGCQIYGISAWNINLTGARQTDLVITPSGEPVVTVDNLEVAQFIYLLLNNAKIRDVINTMAEKAVLILGRFTPPGRKTVLDAIREALRSRGFLPIVFDFERPTDRDFTETIMILAGMCLFIIADLTNPKSSPLELQAAVPDYMIPFVPIIQEGEEPFAMFKDLRGKFDWVLDPLAYDSASHLISGLEKAVIQPALKKHDELLAKKVAELRVRHIRDYL